MEDKYVDISKKSKVTCVEWFHGYGGNALGLKRAIPGLRSIAVCERDAFVVANMVSKMEAGLLDAVPIWTDVTDFPTEPFGYQRLDLFVASYPCQGFSHAGKRLGVEDHRHLWPYCRKFVKSVRPGWVWLENVEGHVTLGLSTVLADLEEDGYTSAWGIFSASEVGAPHQRKRVFILSYDDKQLRNDNRDNIPRVGESQKLPELGCGNGEGNSQRSGGEDVAHIFLQGLQGHTGDVNREGRETGGEDRPTSPEGLCGDVWPSRPGERQYPWEPQRVVISNSQQSSGQQRCTSDLLWGRSGKAEQIRMGNSEESKHRERQTQPPVGGNSNGSPSGLDFPGCTGLSDIELEEIYGWMVKGTNRTDELRMCGNGVVPQTAERAFKVLHTELLGRRNLIKVVEEEI